MAVQMIRGPFIDTIHFAVPLNSSSYSFVRGQLEALYEEQKTFLPCGRIRKKAIAGGLAITYHVKKDAVRFAYLEARKIGKKNFYLRVQIDPPKANSEQFIAFQAALDWALPDQNYKRLFCEARISRLDVAVDFVGRPIEHLMPHRPKSVRSRYYWLPSGERGGLYLGSARSPVEVNMYDRAKKCAELPKTGCEPFKVSTRLEMRLRCSGLKGENLISLKSPFASLEIADAAALKSLGSELWWLEFFANAEKLGTAASLHLLEKKRKKIARTRLAHAGVGWWQPEEIWGRWPKALKKVTPVQLGETSAQSIAQNFGCLAN